MSGTIGWQHGFGDSDAHHHLCVRGGLAALHRGRRALAQDALVLGLGLGAKLGDMVDFNVSYSGQLAASMSENAVKGTLAWKF